MEIVTENNDQTPTQTATFHTGAVDIPALDQHERMCG